MKVAIASDHRGIDCKKEVIKYLEENNHEVIDCSPINTDTDDYPDFAFKVCEKVTKKEADIGILVCRTGIGMSIAANKVKGIRCAKVDSVEDAILCRNDNAANVMTFNFTKSIKEIDEIIEAFINADVLTNERHARRVKKIMDYEKEKN